MAKDEFKRARETYDETVRLTREKLQGEVRDFLASAIQAQADQAQARWDAGASHLALRLPSGTQPSEKFDEGLAEWIGLQWGEVLDRVVAIGWQLHTWNVVENDTRLIATPLFIRP